VAWMQKMIGRWLATTYLLVIGILMNIIIFLYAGVLLYDK